MDVPQSSPVAQYNPLRWIPEFLELGRRRLRSQARLLGWSILVGIVAGLGAVVFLPVTDANGRFLGVVSLEEAHLASQSPNLSPLVVAADLMRNDVTPLQLDDRLDRAQELFVEHDLLALPVVNDLAERRVVGMVRRSDIAGAYLRHVHGVSSRSQ